MTAPPDATTTTTTVTVGSDSTSGVTSPVSTDTTTATVSAGSGGSSTTTAQPGDSTGTTGGTDATVATGTGSTGATGSSACATPTTQTDGATPAPAGTACTTPDPNANTSSGVSPPSAWAIDLSADGAAHTISVGSDGTSLSVTVDGTTTSRPVADVTSLSVTSGAGDDVFSYDGSAGVPVTFDAGGGTDTLHGPTADTTWTISGAGSGSLGTLSFAGFENLSGAADNKDTFVFEAGGSVQSVDGGDGGYDSLVLAGHPDTVVSTPSGPHSGTLVVDGTTIAYAGLEPADVSAANITINGGENGNPSPIPQGDYFNVSPYTDDSVNATCATAGNCIQIQDFDTLTKSISAGELNFFVIAGTSSLTINGGAGSDITEFTGNFIAHGLNLTVNTESIKLDSGVTVDVGTGTVNFNAVQTDDGTDALGVDTTLLGDTASIELDSAKLSGASVDLEASATNAKTSVNGDQSLTGLNDNLFVVTTTPFLSRGKFTIDGLVDGLGNPQTCSYTGTSNRNEFTGVSGCIGPVSGDAAVDSVGILEDQSLTGFDHAALQLIYGASINIHGSSSITATSGDVTLASSVDVTGTANGKPLAWVSGQGYKKDDVVTFDDKLYKATADIASSLIDPKTDTANWTSADGQNAALAVSVLVANAKSQLSGTSTISAASGNVTISANLKTSITTEGDATQSSSGAAFAVGVVVTDTEAFVDSTASTPVLAKSLTVSADTNNTSPTTAKASPGGANSADNGGTGKDPNKPSAEATSTSDAGTNGGNAAAAKGDGMSKTSDGDQPVSAAFGVTVLVATTKAYVASLDGTPTTISTADGTDLVHAGSTNTATSTADAGNVKFSPDTPTLTFQSLAGLLDGGTSYFYKVTSLFGSDTAKIAGAGQFVDGLGTPGANTLTVDDASDFDAVNGKFMVASGGGITGVCTYATRDATTFHGVSGCSGTSADGFTVTGLDESVASPEATVAIPSSNVLNAVTVKWAAVPGAKAYEIYRATTSGEETFIGDQTDPGPGPNVSFIDDSTAFCSLIPASPKCSNKPPDDDDKSGVGVGVGVTVVDVTTSAYIGNNVTIHAKTVNIETTAPSASTYSATAISGAGGTSVGVAGSIAVLVVVNNSTSGIAGASANATLDGDLSLSAASNLGNTALATAKQSSDGSTSGVGASFALDVVNDTTTAGLADGSTISGANNLTISSTDTDASSTTANGGASAGSGSFALSAQVAITLANVTTTASVGTGNDLTLSGGLTAKAVQSASAKTIASGASKGGSATIGLSLALALINDNVFSQLARNLTAGGAVSFAASGISSNDTEATASSTGSPGKKDSTSGSGSSDGAKNPKTNADEGTVNQKADANLGLANDTSNASGGKDSGTKNTPTASSGEGGGTTVTVAAAAAIAVAAANAISSIADNLTLSTPKSVSFATTEDTDSTAKASGSAVKGSSVDIGAAIAINLVKVTNAATIGFADLIDSSSLTLSAAMAAATGSAPDGKYTLDTEATAGGGNGKIGIAGSLALEFADIVTTAEIKANSTRGPPDQINGNISLTATSSVSSTVKASASDPSTGTVGIGAGAAINSVNDTTTASIDDGAVISGASAVTLSATSTDSETTSASSGVTGASGSDVVFTADAAISLPTVLTSATIGGDGSQTLDASGAVSLTAKQTASATTTAKADASTSDVVIGLALALAVPDDEVYATDSRELKGSTVSFSATGTSTTTTEADASAAGAKGDSGSGDGSGKDVNGKADQQLSNANTQSTSANGTSSKTKDTSNAQATTSDQNSSGGNTVTVAGAAGINVVTTIYQATLADAVVLTATGLLSLKTSANTDASAVGNGKATGAGTVGIGAGVAVNKVTLVNQATPNNATITSKGIDVEAAMTVNGKDQIQVFDGKDWKTIESGSTFPEDPENNDYFQLTKAVAPTTTVSGASQKLEDGSLTVASTLGFFPLGGTFTVEGVSGTCSYEAATPGVPDAPGVITGITGCKGTPEDKAAVTVTTSTTVNAAPATTTVSGASQNLAAGTLNVASTLAFPSTSGTFTVAGIAGICEYTGTTPTSFTGILNCGGTPADGALVTWVDTVNTTATSTTVNDPAADLSTGSLTVKSVAAFPTGGGQFVTVVNGAATTCSFTGTDTTNSKLTGISGCTGKPTNGAAVQLVIPTLNSLQVASTAGFDPLGGQLTATGLNGTCTYSSAIPLLNEIDGITGCTGTVADKTAVQYVGCSPTVCTPPPVPFSPPAAYSFASGIYQWHALVPLLPHAPGYWVHIFTSGPILPTSPNTGDYFLLTGSVTVPTLTAGLYMYDGTNWVSRNDIVFPEDPAPVKGDFFQLTEHYFLANGQSGAGGDKDKVSIAGALGLNIISDHTSATLGAAETVHAGSGDITLKATNNEEDAAKADSDAKAGSVGIGASVALDIVNDTSTIAAIPTGTTVVGGKGLTVSALAHHTIVTEDKAGSEGGVAISPSVSIGIANDVTTATIGLGTAMTVTGDATISANETLVADLDSNASAGGDNVKIGAAVAVNVITVTTSATLLRDLTAGSLAITSATETSSGAKAEASTKGADDAGGKNQNADQQSSEQVSNNPNTSGQTNGSLPKASDSTSSASDSSSSQTGDSDSGGVGIAAAVSVNWVRSTNTASIAPGLHVTATGKVSVTATDVTNANAFALGAAVDLKSDTSIGAGVGLNVENVSNTAFIGSNANVSGDGVAVEATSPEGKESDFVVWGIAAAGGKNTASIAAAIGVQVLTVNTQAYIGDGAVVTSTGELTVNAEAPLGVQNIALAGGLSTGGTAVGGAIAVNVLTVTTLAYVGAGSATYVNATGAFSVTASSHVVPVVPDTEITKITFPALSSIALGGSAGGGDAAVTGSFVVDVLTIDTEAHLAVNVDVNDPLHGGTHGGTDQTLTVSATDDTHLINAAGAIALTEGSAGVGVGVIVEVITKDVKAYISDGVNVFAGGDVKVDAISTEELFEVSAEAAASTDGAAVAGGIIVVLINAAGSHGTTASIGDATVQGLGIEVKASDIENKLELYAGNISFGDSAGIGVAIVVLVHNGTVDAHVATGATLTAGADGVTVSATQGQTEILVAGAGAGGGDAGVAGSVVVDVLNHSTTATLDGTTTSGGTVAVSASDTTNVISVAGQLAIGGTAGVGVGVDVEVITKDTEATIAPFASVTTTGAGNVTVGATSQETVVQVAAGLAVGGSAAVAVNAGVSVYSITTDAHDRHPRERHRRRLGRRHRRRGAPARRRRRQHRRRRSGGRRRRGIGSRDHEEHERDDRRLRDRHGRGQRRRSHRQRRLLHGHRAGHALQRRARLGRHDQPRLHRRLRHRRRPSSTTTATPAAAPTTATRSAASRRATSTSSSSSTPTRCSSPTRRRTRCRGTRSTSPRAAASRTGSSRPTRARATPTARRGSIRPTDVSGNTINLPYTLSVSTGDQVVYGAGGGTPIGGLTDGATYYAISMGGNSYELADTKCHATGLVGRLRREPRRRDADHARQVAGDRPVTQPRRSRARCRPPTPPRKARRRSRRARRPASPASPSAPPTATRSPRSASLPQSAVSAGVGVSGTVNVITVNTSATIGKHAVVNDNAGAAAGPNVFVAAGNQFHETLAAASLAIGGGAGVGSSVDVAILHLNADALIDDSATVRATNDIIVVVDPERHDRLDHGRGRRRRGRRLRPR